MKKIYHLSLSLLLLCQISFGQTAAERKQILQKTNVAALEAISKQALIQSTKEKQNAIAEAQKRGLPITVNLPGGGFSELQRIEPDGTPIYYITSSNVNAAITTRANTLWTGGSMGLNLNGQNMIVGEWDGGAVRATHQEFGSRVTQKDNITFTSSNSNTAHATHVAGTLIASGVQANAKGMAHQGNLWANDWNNDVAEMASQAAEGLLISNHSYGYDADFLPTWYFGFYDSEAANWDQMARNAPFYTMVKAAGNDRNNSPKYNPGGVFGTTGYNLITGAATAKNVLVVAAVSAVTNYTGPSSVTMSSFSSWGPTDDGRIKPDISGCGVSVTSPVSSSNTAYATYNGTSMASPNVAGSLLLVQQHYKNVNNGSFLNSASLRGLTIHTADEAGSDPGPDYRFGWGLMNAQKMVQTINNRGTSSIINELSLNNGATYTTNVVAVAGQPIEVTICWNDFAGTVLASGTSNSTSARLVNDLDVRITYNGTTTFPWILDPANPANAATRGDNTRDNVEKILLSNPVAGASYTITVTHKGNLRNLQAQPFSFIVTGINANPVCAVPTGFNVSSVTTSGATVSWGAVTSASSYDLRYRVQNTVTWTNVNGLTSPTRSITGLNAGTTYEYQVRTVCPFGTSNYSATQTFTTTGVCLVPSGFSVNNIGSNGVTVNWGAVTNANTYDLRYRVQNTVTWTNINGITTNNSNIAGLSPSTIYQYEVRTNCSFGSSNYSATQTFTTQAVCGVPSTLTTTNIGTNNATLSWQVVNQASGYELNYREIGAQNWISLVLNNNSTNLSGLQPNTNYEWRVNANCGFGTSAFSSIVTFSTNALQICDVPIGLTTSNLGTNLADLSWNAVGNAVSYDVNIRQVGALSWNNYQVTGNTFNASGLNPSTAYEWQVRSICSFGNSAYSNIENFTTNGLTCSVPTDFVESNITPNSFSISWGAVGLANNFTVRFRQAGGTWSNFTTNLPSFTFNNLLEGTAYEYRVRSNCTGTSSIFSNAITVVTAIGNCAVPNNPSHQINSPTEVLLSWQAVQGAVSYEVAYTAVGSTNWVQIQNITTNQIPVTGLIPATNYQWEVSTICTGINSPFSAPQYFTTWSNVCETPTNLFVNNVSPSSAQLNWTVVPIANSYQARYRLSGTTAWTSVTVSGSNNNAIVIQGLQEASTYQWQMRPLCSGSNGLFSPIQLFVSGSTVCDPAIGLNTNSVGPDFAVVSWQAITGATSYTVQVREVGHTNWIDFNATTNSITISGLNLTTNYEWRVATICNGLVSNFSSVANFTTTGPVCSIPTNLMANNITANAATLNWQLVTLATRYVVMYRPTSQTTWITVSGLTTNSLSLSNLQPGQTYEWMVRSRCGTESSSYSPASTFTTLTLGGNQINAFEQPKVINIQLFPNPVSLGANTNLMLEHLDKTALVNILDISGRLVYSNAIEQDYTILPTNNLKAGVYFVNIQMGDVFVNKKLIIQ